MSVERDMRSWHEAIGQRTPQSAEWPDEATVALRVRLIREEADELVAALENREPLEDVAKEACDVVFTAVHAVVSMGIPFDECWRRVHESNMAKAGGPVREDGKILKPPGWQPPDLRSALYPEPSISPEPPVCPWCGRRMSACQCEDDEVGF